MASPTLYRPDSIPTGLAVYYKFDGDATDSSSSGFDLTPVASPTYAAIDFWNSGEDSVDLNGTTQYFTGGDNLDLNGKSYSVAFWVKADAAVDYYIIGKGVAGSTGYYLRRESTGYLSLYMGAITNTGTGVVIPDKWHHVVVTYNNSSTLVNIYVDGNLVTSATNAGVIADVAGDFTVGSRPNVPPQLPLNGRLKDLAMWVTADTSAVLTPIQAKSLAMGVDMDSLAYRPGNTTVPPDAWYPCNELSGLRADAIGSLDLTPTATPGVLGGFVEGVAPDFNGSTQYLTSASNAIFSAGTSDFTLCAWAFFETLGSQHAIVSTGHTTNNISMTWFNSGNLYVYMQGSARQFSWTPVIGTWYHILLKRTSGELQAFVDGVEIGAAITSTETLSGVQQFGVAFDGAVGKLNGRACDAGWWNGHAVPQDEISALASAFPIQQQGISSYWKHDEPKGGKDVTAVGNAKQVPYKINKSAAFFDGTTGNYLLVPQSTDWDLGSGDYSIEVYFNMSENKDFWLWDRGTAPANRIGCLYQTGRWYFYENGGQIVNDYIWTPTLNTWYKMKLERSSGTATMYVDDTARGTPVVTSTNITGTTELVIGAVATKNGSYFHGWMKNFVITKASTEVLNMAFDTPATVPLAPAIWFPTGATDFLTVADSADWDYGTGDFTIESWVYQDADHAGANAIYDNGYDVNGIQCHFYWDNASAGYTNIYLNSGVAALAVTGLSVKRNAWHHLAWCRSSGTLKCFLDGREIGSVANSTNISGSTQLLTIGKYYNSTTAATMGYLKEYRVSDNARYTTDFTPTQDGFTADVNTMLYLKALEDNGDATFVDSSTVPKAITTNGDCVIRYFEDYRAGIFVDDSASAHLPYPQGATKVDFFVPFGDSVARFDGVVDKLTIPTHDDWNVRTGDFTCEGYIRRMAPQVFTILFSRGTNEIMFRTGNGADENMIVYLNSGLVGQTGYVSTPRLELNIWYHVAFSRQSGIGRIYINGNLGLQAASTQDLNSSSVMQIGALQSSDISNAMMDLMRFSSGLARYTEECFNPPSEIPISDGYTALQMDMDNATNFESAPALDGTGDAIFISNANKGGGFEFGTGAFTVEGWFNFSSLPSVVDLLNLGQGGARGVRLQYNTGSLYLTVQATSGPNFVFAPGFGSWYHLAAVRESTASNKTHIFINGVRVASGTNAGNVATASDVMNFCSDQTFAKALPGFAKNIRVSNVARYTDASNFVPATDFTSDGNTVVLIKGNEPMGSGQTIVPDMTSAVLPAPYVASADSEFSGTYAAWKAFDSSGASNWASTITAFPHWLKLDLGTAVAIDEYRVTGNVGNGPKDWTFEGSNTGAFGGEEITLDTVVGQPASGLEVPYQFTNSTAYRYYRLNISAGQAVNEVDVFNLVLCRKIADSSSSALTLNINGDLAIKGCPGNSAAFQDDGGAGSGLAVTLADEIGTNNLTTINDPVQSVGKVGNSTNFEQLSQQSAQVGSVNGLRPGTGDFAYSAWVKKETTIGAQEMTLCGTGRGNLANGDWSCYWYLNQMRFRHSNQSTWTFVMADGIWYHIIVMRDVSTTAGMKFYLNGVLITPVAANTNLNLSSVNDFSIATHLYNGSTAESWWDGLMDETTFALRYYRPEEAKTLYIKGHNELDVDSDPTPTPPVPPIDDGVRGMFLNFNL